LALLVWLASLTLTAWLWQQAHDDAELDLRTQFVQQTREFKARLQDQLNTHALILKSFAGLFIASNEVSREEFRHFYRSLGLDQGAYGFVAVAYVQAQASATPIVYIEPFEGANRSALGLDVSGVPVARAALHQARDSASLVLSAKLTLKQDEGHPAPGFVMYLPLYRNGTDTTTLAQRRANIVGWIDAPFRSVDFLGQTLKACDGQIDLQIFDGTDTTAATLLFDSDDSPQFANSKPARFEQVQALRFGGNTWTLRTYAKPDFGAETIKEGPPLVAASGVLLGTLLALLTAATGRNLQRRAQDALDAQAQVQAKEREALRSQSERALRDSEFAARMALGRSNTLTQELNQHREHLEDLVQQRTHDLQQAQQAAQAASLAKSAFLANMSHEIRTPMNGVVGMVDILQQTELQPDQQRMLATIHQSALALLRVLNDILDYSKVEANQLAIESIPTPLHDLVQGTAQLMVHTAVAQSIELTVTLAPDLPQWVMADPTRLRQVLLNLLGNALKFTHSDASRLGRVALSATRCTLANAQAGLQFTVSDNGIGMSAEVLAKLFKPFSQADASTSREFGGTGLGLSISQRLATLMGGHIRVQSRPGEGSEFTLELPLLEAPAQAPVLERRVRGRGPAPSLAQAAAQGRLILLAEDNETNREVLREQLRLLGYASEVAPDGAQALALWRAYGRSRYCLLLTDCHMPHLDGFALTRAIRAEEATPARLPIIAVTANAMQGEAQNCVNSGMDDYLTKPLRLQALGAMLNKWLSPVTPSAEKSTLIAANALPERAAGIFEDWNPNTLNDLVGDNPELQRSLLGRYLGQAHQQVADIAAAVSVADLDQLRTLSHTLKSAARSVGALRLGEHCQQLEAAAKAGNAATCEVLVTDLASIFEASQAMIEACLARPNP
jgi:signal transduction histidine kinase/FixJ family two-component response regulator/HPt (histidine-containing phosphotransfer) domain-containing protein